MCTGACVSLIEGKLAAEDATPAVFELNCEMQHLEIDVLEIVTHIMPPQSERRTVFRNIAIEVCCLAAKIWSEDLRKRFPRQFAADAIFNMTSDEPEAKIRADGFCQKYARQ